MGWKNIFAEKRIVRENSILRLWQNKYLTNRKVFKNPLSLLTWSLPNDTTTMKNYEGKVTFRWTVISYNKLLFCCDVTILVTSAEFDLFFLCTFWGLCLHVNAKSWDNSYLCT